MSFGVLGWRICHSPSGCIIRVGTLGAVHHGPLTMLLDTFVCESLAIPMLAEPYGLGNSIKEPDHVMFPVPNMIADFLP